MAIKLLPMSQTEFDAFAARTVPAYAQSKVDAGSWTSGEALQKARDQFNAYLPDGLTTPGHSLFSIVDANHERRVGDLWMSERQAGSKRTAFILDLFIDEMHRGQSFGAGAIRAFEKFATDFGFDEIGLHVFGHNVKARNLYERLGYQTMDISMNKLLKPRAAP